MRFIPASDRPDWPTMSFDHEQHIWALSTDHSFETWQSNDLDGSLTTVLGSEGACIVAENDPDTASHAFKDGVDWRGC